MNNPPVITKDQKAECRRHFWQISCQGKETHENRAVAESVARRRGNRAYRCRVCGYWHTGRHSAWKPKRWSR